MSKTNLSVIGKNELVEICGRKNVPAKIDTGADSSSVWASDIEITEDNILRFKLFGPKSPFYNGKILSRTDYKVAAVRSATGEEQIRFRTHLTLKVAGKSIRALVNLSDRSKNNYPILLGRRTLNKKFLVDVSKSGADEFPITKTKGLQKELEKDPYKFYQKYVKLAKEGE